VGGFTLLEILVVIAVIGVLMTLLLPAVLATQERARQTLCLSRLKQIATAMMMYEQQEGVFPTGCLGCVVRATPAGQPRRPPLYLSWNIALLPGLEQNELFDQFNFDWPSNHLANRTAAGTSIDLFLCPNTTPDLRVNDRGFWKGLAFTDFAGVYGVEGAGRNNLVPGSLQTLREDSLGVMLFETPVPRRDILDGSSYTVVVAEMNDRRTIESEWANGQNLFAQLATNPINGRSGVGNDLGSAHPGGAQVTLADGHAVFLSESMDQGVLNALLTKAGKELARP
jgi:type II secretion system protein G